MRVPHVTFRRWNIYPGGRRLTLLHNFSRSWLHTDLCYSQRGRASAHVSGLEELAVLKANKIGTFCLFPPVLLFKVLFAKASRAWLSVLFGCHFNLLPSLHIPRFFSPSIYLCLPVPFWSISPSLPITSSIKFTWATGSRRGKEPLRLFTCHFRQGSYGSLIINC